MNKNKLIYGSLGFLSILGILGIVTESKIYLAYFAFAVHLKYLFIETDEMLESYMNQSAAVAFYLQNLSFVIISLFRIFILKDDLSHAFVLSFIISWSISIFMYTILVLVYEFRERRGMKND